MILEKGTKIINCLGYHQLLQSCLFQDISVTTATGLYQICLTTHVLLDLIVQMVHLMPKSTHVLPRHTMTRWA